MAFSSFRVRKLAASSLIALSLAAAASAQAADDAREFEIEAKPLAEALTDFSRQSDLIIIAPRAMTEGRMAAAVDGALTPDQALAQLLTGSGLAFDISEDGAVSLRPLTIERREQGEAEAEAEVIEASMSARQAVAVGFTSQTSQQPMGPTGEAGQPGIVRGVVRAAEANAGLDGALITIEETGQTTSTDDLGRFRFANVPAGRYTVTVSYLGFAETSQVVDLEAGGDVTLPFQLASALDVIVVRGSRSARAQALNRERTADNISTVLSSDFLGQFDGATISEALRRAPGIAFEQDEVTGDGTNIIVRGLAPDLNTVTLNGLRLPEGSGTGRSADLSNILTESIAEITINKTLLPSQDSSGTGGLIEIVTKGPLDRDRRFANLSIQGSQRDNDFYEDYLASGTVSGIFGADDNFGLSLSVQYREQDIRRLSYDVPVFVPNGVRPLYLPLAGDGTPLTGAGFIDPRTPFPFDDGAPEIYPTTVSTSSNGAETTNLSVTVSGQWQISNHTEIRFDYTRADEERDSFTQTLTALPFSRYQPLAVSELGGEVRNVLVWQDALAGIGQPGAQFNANRSSTIENGRSDITNTFSFQGKSEFSSWEINYALGYADAETIVPFTGSLIASAVSGDAIGFLSPEGLQNVTSNGLVVSPFSPIRGDNFPDLLFTQEGFDFYNDPSQVRYQSGTFANGNGGSNERTTIEFSARYNFAVSAFRYLEAGLFFEEASFQNAPVANQETIITFAPPSPDQPSLTSVGLTLVDGGFSDVGINNSFLLIGRSGLAELFGDLSNIGQNNPGILVFPQGLSDSRLQDAFGEERNFSAYLQGHFDWRNLEVVGGVRIDSVDVQARNLVSPFIINENGTSDPAFAEENVRLVDQEGSQTTVLPRIAITYRRDENLLLRAGYSVTVARPQIQNLSDQSRIGLILLPTTGPNANQPGLVVANGNPDLEPARTQNFDFQFEQYFQDVGQIKFGIFYKRIENALELNSLGGVDTLDGVVLPDDARFQNLPDNIFIEVTTPVNADDDAEIWGIEAAFEKQLTFLPGIWSGFGVFANYTYTDSSKTQPFSFFDFNTFEQVNIEVEDVPFDGSPEHSGTVAVTYNGYGIDASLSYTQQARRLREFQAFNLSLFDEEDDSLDFRAEYRFDHLGASWRVWATGSDLLKGPEDADIQTSLGGTGGTPAYFIGGNYFGGRTLSLGLAASF